MPETQIFNPPTIEPTDIEWICALLGLPQTAFSGTDGTDPRLTVLRSMNTLDIEACPGSGKTTLLVAKLAILANKWDHQRRGICVLSHTNAARREIETKLSSCSAGNALLRYPHFVGTIHSFVNEFLAIPWLRSQGYPIKAIDTEIALNVRWNELSYKTRSYLNKKRYDKYCLFYDRFDFGGGSKKSLGEHTQTYSKIVEICENTSRRGYFCYDEMFVWAGHLIDLYPNILDSLRFRFPLVFIDEIQDNSELQSAFLHRAFCAGKNSVIRQRFGDSNQEIYQSPEQNGAKTDPFPGPARADLPHSFRFGQDIANLANPLGVMPQGLVGSGPCQKKVTLKNNPNALFLFDDQTILSVLPKYADYLLDTFSDAALAAGLYTAVAGVHKSDKTDKVPRFLGHYAPAYDPTISRKDPSPETFIQYVMSGRREIASHVDVYPVVSMTGAAVLRLAQLAGKDRQFVQHKSPHQCIMELLKGKTELRQSYLSLVDSLILSGGDISFARWSDYYRVLVSAVAATIAGQPATSKECTRFLEWVPQSASVAVQFPEAADNVYRYPPEAPKVNIRLGSIHSVKGETHTATLVLESYFHGHHLENLKPWLLGKNTGGKEQKVRMLGRLKLHYVAMTRPSQLLCLAMRRDSLDDTETAALAARGWHVIDCTGTGFPQNSEKVLRGV